MHTLKHLVIIPDGNRRWAKNHNVRNSYGHKEGYNRIKEIITSVKKKKIPFLTIWAFSTENWKREKREVGDIFSLIKQGLSEIHNIAKKEKTRVVHIGRRDRVSKDVLALIKTVEEETKQFHTFCLCIAIDYGGEDEVRRAEKLFLESRHKNKSIVDFLDTSLAGIPNPDIIIRTGGEKRTSGFMPLQSSYAEYFFSDTLFPDFTTKELDAVLEGYTLRERRFGK